MSSLFYKQLKKQADPAAADSTDVSRRLHILPGCNQLPQAQVCLAGSRTCSTRRTSMRYSLLFAALLMLAGSTHAQSKTGARQDQLPPEFVPSGKDMFKQYCAACHGIDAKGHGPARAALKVPAADLTQLTKRHGQDGQFPYEYVSNVLRFGPGVAAHGSSDMPTWGGIFQYMDNYNQAVVRKRIKNLCDFLATLQEK
jgi:mono/diheme cytochrome c family protein